MGDFKPSAFSPNMRVTDSVDTKASTIDSIASPDRRQLGSKDFDHLASLTDDPLNTTWKLVRGRQWVKLSSPIVNILKESPASFLPRTVSPALVKRLPERLSMVTRSRRIIRQLNADEIIAEKQSNDPSKRQCKLFKEVPRKAERRPIKALRN